MNATLIQAAAAVAFAIATPLLAQAAPQKVEQLPRVVISGKAQQVAQQVVQLPRVVIEGRSNNSQMLMALNTKSTTMARRG